MTASLENKQPRFKKLSFFFKKAAIVNTYNENN